MESSSSISSRNTLASKKTKKKTRKKGKSRKQPKLTRGGSRLKLKSRGSEAVTGGWAGGGRDRKVMVDGEDLTPKPLLRLNTATAGLGKLSSNSDARRGLGSPTGREGKEAVHHTML